MQTFFRLGRTLLIGATVLYGCAILVLVLLWSIETPPTWWLALLNIFALYCFAPLMLLIPLALFIRSLWLRGTVALVTALFVASFGPQLVPHAPQDQAGERLRVMTFNVLFSNREVDAVVAAIRSEDADIVALQELTEPIARGLQQQLQAEYPYQWLEPAPPPNGLGVLSRYPFEPGFRDEAFARQQVMIDVAGQPISFMNVHLSTPRIATRELPLLRREVLVQDYNTTKRAAQTAALLDTIDATQGPVIMLGDLNTSDRERAYAALDARLHDAYRETAWGLGYTFPTNTTVGPIPIPFPLVRIDYIWSKGGITPVDTQLQCASPGSDHCMLIADMRMQVHAAAR